MVNIYKDIKGYEGKYQINEYGEVKSVARQKGATYCKEKILRPDIVSGYVRYALCKDDKVKRQSAHRLVYQTFIGELKEGMHIHHIDENKHNNHVSNLTQTTPLENNHFSKVKKGYKLDEQKVRFIRDNKLTTTEVVEMFDISPRHALRVIKKERWEWVD
ncbi:NUMOD4 motif-containing HNH endonuclease [Staphylococcus sp. GDY8P31P]|uniref:HNH endonuclease n=1 Tax=Staphylococcus sp. GDY8P31P TaxID=2804115 RepID=UPI001AEC68DC